MEQAAHFTACGPQGVAMKTVNPNVQAEVLAALAKLGVGESILIPAEVLGGKKQWELEIERTGEDRLDLEHRSPDGTGRFKFYRFTTHGNPYGAGIIDQEPSLAIPCRDAGIDKDAKLVGAVAVDAEGNFLFRGSWSKCVWGVNPGDIRPYGFTADGEFLLGGEVVGHVWGVLLPDKMRMRGHVALVRSGKPTGPVKEFELESAGIEWLKTQA